MSVRTLADLGAYVRSKNAGPFWLTIDVICSDASTYAAVARSSLTDRQSLATVYDVQPESVSIFLIPELHAVKLSLPRPTVQGSIRDRDAHAGQQYVPLLQIPVP